MKQIIVACGLFVLGLGAFVAGCDTRSQCERAGDDITAKYELCSIDTDGEGDPPQCSVELGTQSACVATCTTEASCEALKGDDSEGAVAYGKCISGC
jgi:hypothetical protein